MNGIWMPLMVLGLAFTSLALIWQSQIERRSVSLDRINAKLDALLKHAGIDFNSPGQVPPQVADALKRGEKIQAIKLYREATGAGLKDAKEFVEAIQRLGGGKP
jgi:hypothetical protein